MFPSCRLLLATALMACSQGSSGEAPPAGHAAPAAADPSSPAATGSASPVADPAARAAGGDPFAPLRPLPPGTPTWPACRADRILDNPDPHPAGDCEPRGTRPPDPPPHRVAACQTSDHYGAAFALGGDWDGDGRPDLAVAGTNKPTTPRASSQVWLHRGAGPAAVVLDGDGQTDLFGAAVVFVPDCDGDGRDEIAVGAPAGGAGGRVHVVRGSRLAERAEHRDGASPARLDALAQADLVLVAGAPDDGLGAALAVADLDGDGRVDLACGAPGPADPARRPDPEPPGAVYVLSDLARWLSGEPRRLALGEVAAAHRGRRPGERFGHALAAAGDLDGRPGAELVVGAPAARGNAAVRFVTSGTGAVAVLSAAAGVSWDRWPGAGGSLPLADGEAFGWSLAAGPDLDGDGRAEIAAGSMLYSTDPRWNDAPDRTGRGRVWILPGAGGAPEPADGAGPTRIEGLVPRGLFGSAVAWTDDLSGDGRAELVVGAMHESGATVDCPHGGAGGPLAGAVHVVDVVSATTIVRMVAESGRDRLGYALAAGDLDGDGASEIVSGGMGYTAPRVESVPAARRSTRTEVGRVYLFAGSAVRDVSRR